jgi:uncharacterized RDD family membrane protein YckC
MARQPSNNENSKESGRELSSKEQSLSERLTSTDSDINAYSIAPIPADNHQPSSTRSFHEDASKAPTNPAPPSAAVEFEYAGFVRRYLAAITDDFFLYWLVIGFIGLYVGAFMLIMHFLPRLLGVDSFSRQMLDAANVIVLLPGIPLCMWLVWLYCAGLESSPMEATPGKRLLGMRVLDVDGRRMSFWKSTRKAFIPAILMLVSIVAWIVMLFATSFIKGPLAAVVICAAVIMGIFALAAFLAACLGNVFFINKKNQTLHDLLSRRIVVKRSKVAPSNSRWARFKLLPVELKVLGLVFSGFVIFIAEFGLVSYCNVETKGSTAGVFVLNTSGHVWRSKRALKSGEVVDLKDCIQETLPLFRTPPFALDPSAKLGRILVCSDVAPGAILTYSSVLPQTVGISNIISIEPIRESNYSLSCVYGGSAGYSEQSAKHVDYQLQALKTKYPDEQWLIRLLSGEMFRATAAPTDDIDTLKTAAIESNKSKNFDQALGSTEKALSLLFERYTKQNPVTDTATEAEQADETEGTQPKQSQPRQSQSRQAKPKQAEESPKLRPSAILEQAIKTSKKLPGTVKFDMLSVEYRSVLIDLLTQRSIALKGLSQEVKAKVDAANCISLLKSLNQDSLAARKKEFLALPDLENAGDTDSSSSSDAQSDDSNSKTDENVTADTNTNTNTNSDTKTGTKASTKTGIDTDTAVKTSTDTISDSSDADADASEKALTIEDADAIRYLSMLAKSDEKRYKDFLLHMLKQFGN